MRKSWHRGSQALPTGEQDHINIKSDKLWNNHTQKMSCTLHVNVHVMQTVDPDADTAVVCTDGVCRLVPVASLKRGSAPTVQARSHSMPNGRPSGSQSGSSARQRTQSARRFDIESADSDDAGETNVHAVGLLCSMCGHVSAHS